MNTLCHQKAPASICILRLSAIGDVTHVLPIIATLQQQWPHTKITWIIGALEYTLVKTLPGIEFIIFNKRNGFQEYFKLRKRLAAHCFDILFMMQVSLRANLISLAIKAQRRIGFDRARSHDLHYFFCNEHIEGPCRVHVLDGFFQFLQKAGIQQRNMNWLLKAGQQERQFASSIIGNRPCILINPCSSIRRNNYRNWPIPRYAQIIDYLMGKGFQVILTGGPSVSERRFVRKILDQCSSPPLNLTGQTTLPQLLALLEQAHCMIAPDTGPAHIATIAATPVIGLFASSNPLRSGPYLSQQRLINAYPQALKKYKRKSVDEARWGERVRVPEVMNLITLAQLQEKVDQCLN